MKLLSLVFLPSSLLGLQSNQDFLDLRDSLKSFIATNGQGPDRNIPLIIRAAFHDIGTFDKNGFGLNGCLYKKPKFLAAPGMDGLTPIMQQLDAFVSKSFPGNTFSDGDIMSLAGKVAVEAAFPCIQVPWSYGRPSCKKDSPDGLMADPSFDHTVDLNGPGYRYNLSYLEMGILMAGGHGLKGAQAAFDNSFFSNILLAKTNSGKDWLLDTFNIKWKLMESRSSTIAIGGACHKKLTLAKDACPLGKSPSNTVMEYHNDDSSLLRFPSDMILFPSVLQQVYGSQPDEKALETESILRKFAFADRSVFDGAFGITFAKMLNVGVENPSTSLVPLQEEVNKGVCI